MLPINESFSVVIVGAWNHKIFTANWVAANLLGDQKAEVELAYPMGDPSLPNRLAFGGLLMYASATNIKLTPTKQSVGELRRCQDVARAIIETLPHTPISAVGINFGFVEEEGYEQLVAAAGLSELQSSPEGYQNDTASFEVKRTFSVSADVFLNHSLKFRAEGGAGFEFNYHHNGYDAQAALGIMKRQVIDEYYEDAQNLMRSLYNVRLPE